MYYVQTSLEIKATKEGFKSSKRQVHLCLASADMLLLPRFLYFEAISFQFAYIIIASAEIN
jgi:hypothetical protein